MTSDQLPPTSSHPTFLFTDIVKHSDMVTASGRPAFIETFLNPHNDRLHKIIAQHHGYVDGTEGDSYFVAFDRAEHALDCARAIHESLTKSLE